jgi:hypothetical protein
MLKQHGQSSSCFQSHAHFKADVAILVRYHKDFIVEIAGAITREDFYQAQLRLKT